MYGSDTRLSSSSTPTKQPQTPKDENEKSYQEIGPNLQSPKIPIKKHYMSPTVSAASKIILPKRKILGENNQSFDNHLPKTPNIRASHESSSLSQKTPSRCNDSVDTEQQNYANFVSDSVSRPQFLCYSSSRHREILRLRENEKIEGCNKSCISMISSFESKKEAGEENVSVEAQEALISSSTDDSTGEEEGLIGAMETSIGEKNAFVGAPKASIGSSIDYPIVEQIDSVDDQNTLISASIVDSPKQLFASVGAQETSSGFDSSIKQEDEDFDDELEEIEEARGWSLTIMLKYFLVFAALVFLTSYISTMNSYLPTFSSQAINSLGERYYFTQNSINQLGMNFEDVRQCFGTADAGNGEEEENADDLSGFIEPEDLEILDAETDLEIDQLDEQQQNGENEILESQAAETDRVLRMNFEDVRQCFGTADAGNGEEEENADDLSGFIEPEDLEILDAETDLEIDQLDEQQQNGENEILESQAAETDRVLRMNFEDVRQCFGTADAGNGEEEENADDLSGFIEPEDLEILDAETDLEIDQLDEQQQNGENEILESQAAETDRVCDNETVESEEILDYVMAAVEKFESSEGSQILPVVNVATEPIKVVSSVENEISMTPIEVANSVDTEDFSSSKDEVIEHVGPGLYPKVALTLCAIVASLVFGFHFMKKKQVQNSEKSKSILHNEDKEKTRSTFSFARCQSVINPTESYESYTGDDVSNPSEVTSQSYSQPAPSDCSYGSFTTQERFFREKKDGAEISVTPVRRSSRLQNRAILSPRKLQYR